MPINPQVAQKELVYRARDIIVDALIEIGMLAPGEDVNLDPSTGQWAFRKLNYLLDEWAADNMFVYAVTFGVFTLVPGLSPHTIGPGTAQAAATFPVAQRPTKIESAAFIFPSGTETPISVEDDDWWSENPVKALATPLQTFVYYSADNPNGSLYFWPVPTSASQVRLRFWTLLNQFIAITDPVDGPGGVGILPPAYRNALMLSLAEQMQTSGGKEADSSLAQRAMKARSALMSNNQMPPRISTRDSGMPSEQVRPRFNFLTREPW